MSCIITFLHSFFQRFTTKTFTVRFYFDLIRYFQMLMSIDHFSSLLWTYLVTCVTCIVESVVSPEQFSVSVESNVVLALVLLYCAL